MKSEAPKFKIQTKATALVNYTDKVTENTKHFPKYTRGTIVKRLRNTSYSILEKITKANEINKNWITPMKQRVVLQEEILCECSTLLVLINSAYESHYISERQSVYWGELVLEIKRMVKSWHDNTIASIKQE